MTRGIQRPDGLLCSLLSVDLDLMGETASHLQISLNAVVSLKHCSYSSLSFSFTSFRRFAVWKPITVTTLQRTPSKRFCKDHTQTIMQQLKQPLKQTYTHQGSTIRIFSPTGSVGPLLNIISLYKSVFFFTKQTGNSAHIM